LKMSAESNKSMYVHPFCKKKSDNKVILKRLSGWVPSGGNC